MIIVAALLFAPSENVTVVEARGAYEECMGSYAQVEMTGGKSALTIALEAARVCKVEERAFSDSLDRANATTGGHGFHEHRMAAIRRIIKLIEGQR